MDYMADYNEAQASGLHHVECDGYMTAHRVEIVATRTGSKVTPLLYKPVCAECGELFVGSFGNRDDAVRSQAGHSQKVKCDGRCKLWETAA